MIAPPDSASVFTSTSDAGLRLGQSLETEDRLVEAVAAYDRAIKLRQNLISVPDIHARRTLGLLWMNRGNALQKLAVSPSASCRRGHPTCNLLGYIPSASAHEDIVHAAVKAYDEAIERFATLPFTAEPLFRNHLGAAWLNRGRALILVQDSNAALASFDHAIEHLEKLPLDANPFYRLNLAGAWTNRAHLQFTGLPALSRTSAQRALALLGEVENETPAFAEMGLCARRALVIALGQLLVTAESNALRPPSLSALAAEASDAIDDGLALARQWEIRGIIALRPLALRLFRLGAQIYRVHQPHFLGEFLLENVGDSACFARPPEFRSVADEALREALAEFQRPRRFVVGSPESERILATVRSLRAARAQLFPVPL